MHFLSHKCLSLAIKLSESIENIYVFYYWNISVKVYIILDILIIYACFCLFLSMTLSLYIFSMVYRWISLFGCLVLWDILLCCFGKKKLEQQFHMKNTRDETNSQLKIYFN